MLIEDRTIDILCISETWLIQQTPNNHIDIPSYNVYRCDKGRGGGACIYVKDNLAVNIIDINLDKPTGIEDLWLTVQCRKLPSVIIGCFYRHPKSATETFAYLSDVLSLMCLKNKPFFVLGDFNDDYLVDSCKCKKIVKSLKLSQLITEPTRVTTQSATLLDLIITNKPDVVLDSRTVSCSIADHDLITVTITLKKPKCDKTIKTYRDLSKYDSNTFCNALYRESPNLQHIFNTDDVNYQTELFTDVFNRCLDFYAPYVTKVVRRPPAPWINDEIKELIKDRNNKQAVWKDNRTDLYLHDEYKTAKKHVKTLLKLRKNEYHKEQFANCSGNSAKIWKCIHKLIPTNKGKNIVCDKENVLTKVEDFNNFFADVGENAFYKSQEGLGRNDQYTYTNTMTENNCNPFRPTPIDNKTLVLTISGLKNSNAQGCDKISLRFLKDSLPVTLSYITCIVNTSIVTGVFPTQWKHAIVVPIHKSGDVEDISNFRPISLLPVLSKILEKVISMQLKNYLECNALLSNTQHGFRSNLSTETALLTISKKIYENIDNKKLSLLTLCDLSKAFDSVSHPILLDKLLKLNIDPFWFNDYLKDRTQSVRFNNTISSKKFITYGVPQGSILGPLLFNIYANDISDYIKDCVIVQYADDTQLLHTGNIDNLQGLIDDAQNTLTQTKKFFNRNGLLLNVKKTQCIFIGSRNHISSIPDDIKICLDESYISPSKCVNNLGLYFDCLMSFEPHINEMSRKVFGILMYLNRIKDNFNKDTRITVVQSLVLSKINYCIKIWGASNKTQLVRVQKLQNFAAKVAIGNAKKHDHATPILNELEWLKIKDQYLFELGTLVFNTVKGNFPSWLFYFPTYNDIRTINTRQNDHLYVPRHNTDITRNSHLIMAPKFWNTLPSNITDVNNISMFKKRLKVFLLNNT